MGQFLRCTNLLEKSTLEWYNKLGRVNDMLLKKANDKILIIFDLWQTIAATKVKLFSNIVNILDYQINMEQCIEQISQSPVFLSDEPIENTLFDFFKNICVEETTIKKIIDLWKETAQSANLLPEAKKAIHYLKSIPDIKLCLMSNTDKHGYDNFPEKKFLESSFDYIFLSYSEGITKPNIKCWQRVCDIFNIEYSHVLMIGDNIKQDIICPQNLGIKTISVGGNNTNKTIYCNIDLVDVASIRVVMQKCFNYP